jgi:hypothetical protein
VTQTNYHPRADFLEWRPTHRGANATLDLEAPRDLPSGTVEVVSASLHDGRLRVTMRVIGVRPTSPT